MTPLSPQMIRPGLSVSGYLYPGGYYFHLDRYGGRGHRPDWPTRFSSCDPRAPLGAMLLSVTRYPEEKYPTTVSVSLAADSQVWTLPYVRFTRRASWCRDTGLVI